MSASIKPSINFAGFQRDGEDLGVLSDDKGYSEGLKLGNRFLLEFFFSVDKSFLV